MRYGHGNALLAPLSGFCWVLCLTQVVLARTSSTGASSSKSSPITNSSLSSPTPTGASSDSSGNTTNTSVPSQSLQSQNSFSSSSNTTTSSSIVSTPSSATSFIDTGANTATTSLPPSPPSTPASNTTQSIAPSNSGDPAQSLTCASSTSASTSTTTSRVRASSKSGNKTGTIAAGVVVPVLVLALAAVGFIFYKRRQRARDRREWERTHEAIADAVRQVEAGGSVTMTGAGSSRSAWSHVELMSRGGSAGGARMSSPEADPFGDRPPFADYATSHPLPTTGHGATDFSPADLYQDEPGAESHPSSMSGHIDTSHGSHHHAQ